MKKLLLNSVIYSIFLFAFFAKLPIVNAQVVNTESFDGTTFPPVGWTVTGGFNSQWQRATIGMNPNCQTHSGAGMARFEAFMQQPGSQELMTSPVINYSGASGSIPTFSLWIYRDNSSTAGDSLSIFVNTSTSLTGAVHIGAVARSRFFFLPVNELSNGWYRYTFNIPVSFNTATNYILLNGTSRGGGNIFIDDLSWEEYPVACTSSFTAGSTVASDTLICGGSGDVDLSLTGSGLTSGGLTFQWQSADGSTGPWTDFGNSTISLNSGSITSPTYFRCYVTCSNGVVTDTSSVIFVNVSPNSAPVVTIDAGTTVNFCTGATPISLVASGATTYTWSPNIAINTVGDSAVASPATTTNYNVIGMDVTGCTGSTNITVNVSPTPVVTASSNLDTICNGQSVILNAFAPGPPFSIQYQWQPGSINGPNPTVNPTSPTWYSVTATTVITGCTGHDSVEVYVYPTPTAAFTFTFNNLTYTFTDASSGAISWSWDFGDGSSSDNSQNPVYTYANNGTYTVTLTVSNGNCTNTFTQVLVVLSIGHIQLSNGSELQLHPNPVSDLTTVEFTYEGSSVQLDIINSLGQTVMSKIVYPSYNTTFKTEMDMTPLAKGMYFLRVRTKSESVFLELVKQ